jgi:hypothetical protein
LEESNETMPKPNSWGFEYEPPKTVLRTNVRKNVTGQAKQLGRSLPRNQQVREWWDLTGVELFFAMILLSILVFCFVWGFLDILHTLTRI